jgi:hypothetical protein
MNSIYTLDTFCTLNLSLLHNMFSGLDVFNTLSMLDTAYMYTREEVSK